MTSYQNTFVATARDATLLIEACRVGHIPPARRDVDMAEKSALITSGAVFVFEDIDSDKIHRWVDGRKWSKSRIYGPFLVYEEKRPSHSTFPRDPTGHHSRPKERMTKKAVSVKLENGKRFHLICYHKECDIPYLITPSADPFFAELHVQQDLYPPMTRQGIYGKDKRKSHHVERISLDSTYTGNPPSELRPEISASYTPNSSGANALLFQATQPKEQDSLWQSRVDALFSQPSIRPPPSAISTGVEIIPSLQWDSRPSCFLSGPRFTVYDRWKPLFTDDHRRELNRAGCRYLVHKTSR
jgi:hypothetical protein